MASAYLVLGGFFERSPILWADKSSKNEYINIDVEEKKCSKNMTFSKIWLILVCGFRLRSNGPRKIPPKMWKSLGFTLFSTIKSFLLTSPPTPFVALT